MTLHRQARLVKGLLAAGLLLLGAPVLAAAPAACGWPAWESFKTHMLSADGRVIDYSTPRQHTVSEGQAYALFFALVAGDRNSFARILEWTESNLAGGDFTMRLPAWQWGHLDDGNWGVVDAQAAADADVWIAYTLGEAGRLWHQRRYSVLSALIGNRILREETASIPGLGKTLLPAPQGFVMGPGHWRLNASYVPLQILRRLDANDPDAGWGALLASSQQMIIGSSPKGYAADWVEFKAGKGFIPDSYTQADGSYNAIRVYLWAGLMNAADPARTALIEALRPMSHYVVEHGNAPEHIDTRNGAVRGSVPDAFNAVMVPFLKAAGEDATAQTLRQRLATQPVPPGDYYGQALSLFALGGDEGRFLFAADGSLILPACISSAGP